MVSTKQEEQVADPFFFCAVLVHDKGNVADYPEPAAIDSQNSLLLLDFPPVHIFFFVLSVPA